MPPADQTAPSVSERELGLTRLIDATPDKVFRCWTDPSLMTQWFTPPPWKTSHVEIDLRVGGANLVVMHGPEGQEMPNRGTYLEVVENRKLVFTDAYTGDWNPSAKPFFTVILTFEPEDGKTRYTVAARHWSIEDKQAHEQMGFHTGWGIATDQLAALASTL